MNFKQIVGWIEILGAVIIGIIGGGLEFFINTFEGDTFERALLVSAVIMIVFLLKGIIDAKSK